VLFWHYIHRPVLAKHAHDVGFGAQPWISSVPSALDDPDGCLRLLSYALAQVESVFATSHHTRHAPPAAGAWSLLHPQNTTLQRHCPQLFTALCNAESEKLSDQMLAERSSLFSPDLAAR